MRVYLDDERETPEGWTRTRTVKDTIALLQTGQVEVLSLDHDLGEDEPEGKCGYDVLSWIEAEMHHRGFKPPETILVHSANPSGRARMLAAIDAIRRFEQKG